jgi:predicted tellurium resistance membrane protein TerC
MDRFPSVILFGAGLLGWIGGGMLADDVVLKPWTSDFGSALHYASAAACAVLVVSIGKFLARRGTEPQVTHAPRDLANQDPPRTDK